MTDRLTIPPAATPSWTTKIGFRMFVGLSGTLISASALAFLVVLFWRMLLRPGEVLQLSRLTQFTLSFGFLVAWLASGLCLLGFSLLDRIWTSNSS